MKIGSLFVSNREFKHYPDINDGEKFVFLKKGEICIFLGVFEGTSQFMFPAHGVTIHVSSSRLHHFDMIFEI